ncbi:MAG: thioredoxin domain-containing protein [Chloroflexota bacterium]
MSAKGKESSRKVAFREQRRKQETRNRVLIISIIAVVAVAVAAFLILQNQPIDPQTLITPQPHVRPLVDGKSIGDPNAPIKVEEFSDYRCIHCRDFWERSEARLIEEYIATGKVFFTYTPFSFISPESYQAAEAAYCALDQGKFWEFHDYIFANFETELTDGVLRAIARALELDMAAFDSCFNGGKHQQRVLDDVQYGRGLGITGTPTFSVNGQLVGQAELFETIDQELAKLNP